VVVRYTHRRMSREGYRPPRESRSVETGKTELGESLREKIYFPHVQPILDLMSKSEMFREAPVSPETIKDVLYAFIEQRIISIQVYRSEQHGAAFPVGINDTGALAKKLYEAYGGRVDALEPNTNKKRKEFLFTSLQTVATGNVFAFMEEAMHQMVLDLPRALRMLAEGQEPDSREIYIVGSPTDEYGEMSDTFANRLTKEGLFPEFGSLYAEYIERELGESGNDTQVQLYGISMGASFATSTAERLVADGVVTQDRDDQQGRPSLSIRLDTPVGSSNLPEARKKWQIPLGLVADATYTALADPLCVGFCLTI